MKSVAIKSFPRELISNLIAFELLLVRRLEIQGHNPVGSFTCAFQRNALDSLLPAEAQLTACFYSASGSPARDL